MKTYLKTHTGNKTSPLGPLAPVLQLLVVCLAALWLVAPASADGLRVKITDVQFEGNTLFDDAKLLSVLGDYADKDYDVSEIVEFSDAIEGFYAELGVPIYRVFIEDQNLEDGQLVISIVESVYGEISFSGDKTLTDLRIPFSSSIRTGNAVDPVRLTRITEVMKQLPGVTVTPVLRPREGTNILDLDFNATRFNRRWDAEVSLSNHGTRTNGFYQGEARAVSYSVLGFGDRVSLSSKASNKKFRQAGAGYDFPISYSGLRGKMEVSQQKYTLVDAYSGFSGHSESYLIGVDYPLITRQDFSTGISANIDRDHIEKGLTKETYSSYSSLTLDVSFRVSAPNWRYKNAVAAPSASVAAVRAATNNQADVTLSNAPAFGARIWDATIGVRHIKKVRNSALDGSGSNGRGNVYYGRFSSTQNLYNSFALRSRAQFKYSGVKHLDGSEMISLGGADSIRGYPTSEASSRKGAQVNLDLLYRQDKWTPYAFYDHGHLYAQSESASRGRTMSSTGVGMTSTIQNATIEAVSAWRLRGGKARSDAKAKSAQFWVKVRFAL